MQPLSECFTAQVWRLLVAVLCALAAVSIAGCSPGSSLRAVASGSSPHTVAVLSTPGAIADEIPAYAGEPSVAVRGNMPDFPSADFSREPFEEYSPLDELGRCGPAYAMVGPETMPDGTRGSIGMIRPSGWQVSKYAWVDGGYLYNRCHLIAFQLTGENDNERNLITGTRYLNVQGMQPYESEVAEYVRATGNHVLYRATPVFEGDNLVASGVLLEAQSVEDAGEGARFCVWCYNVEPGVAIDYATGDNEADGTVSADDSAIWRSSRESTDPVVANSDDAATPGADAADPSDTAATAPDDDPAYILNTNTHRFHLPTCPSVDDMKEKNKQPFYGTRDEAVDAGYRPCGVCNP